MLLSIVMMIKNEEKYLTKTLTALQPLMKKIKSELIIVDTGSTDKSIDIARKFTDKIYFEKWNNNFGDMRNKSISYARGDWFLILDADEELIDYVKIIDFFNSDKHKKHNCASIELKNIISENVDNYAKCSILRLFKYNKTFRYEGVIHEQPIHQEPIYNNVASFNHYGYMFVNEEIKQKKLKRNEDLLFSQLKIQPNDPYLNFQIGKNYMCYGDDEEALHYIEKSYELYKKLGTEPIIVYMNLSKLYSRLYKFKKCEKMCLRYIKNDDKNIDIYYYLALSQKELGKYEESIVNYNRYMFLVDNYKLSTQANDVSCESITAGFKNDAEVELIKVYYFLERYDEIVKKAKKIKFDQIKKIYFIIFMSLYRLNKLEEIIELYNSNSSSTIAKKEFKASLEKMILSIKKSDRKKVYKILINIDDNYGLLNEIRLEKKITAREYNEILLKEREMYYGDLVYYALKQEIDLITLLNGVSHLYIQNYMNYIITNRRDCILDLYKYLLNVPNTLDINKLSVYSSLSKTLLFDGNLMEEKYEKLFLMYITYRYDYLKQIYNENLTEEELLSLIKDLEDMFIFNINIIQKLKSTDQLQYIRKMKSILIENPQYKKGIQILINKFENEFKETEELKELKLKYKSLIENSINLGNIENAEIMINEYEEIFKNDKLYNMKAIINIYKNNIDESDKLLKFSYLNNKYDENTTFNIAYIKELKQEYKESLSFYNKTLKLSLDEELNVEVLNKINYIKNIF